jgi:hypothetical protein
MTFKTMEELETYILSKSKVAVEQAKEKIFNIIRKVLKKFYTEFEPEVYVRTYQLFCSLVKTDVKPTVNGWMAEVYFDISALDYARRIVPSGTTWSSNNTFHGESWSDENTKWVLETAMTGFRPHGGYATGTAIWEKSMNILSPNGVEMLKKELIKAGIPIR